MWSKGLHYATTALVLVSCLALPSSFNNGEPGSKLIRGIWSRKSCSVQSYNFSVPVDHFHNDTQYEPHSDEFYPMRYFLQTKYYKPGGPVIVVASGETSAENRVPYLINGIGSLLAKATGGIVLALEHRYYGTSFPLPASTIPNLRFLTTEQAVADTAYFAQHATFPGFENLNLTSANTPWIIYGGSYAGAFAAFARKLYPDAFWGAISSSGVTKAVYDFWEYTEAARLFAPGNCGMAMSNLTHTVDTALFSGNDTKVSSVKRLFRYDASISNAAFGSNIAHPAGGLQSESWIEGENDDTLNIYCANITSPELLFPDLERSRVLAEQFVEDAGYNKTAATLFLNYVGILRKDPDVRQTAEENNNALNEDGIQAQNAQLKSYPSWFYQQCTQWGYFVSGSGAPKDILGITSRAVTLEYAASGCDRVFGISHPPNVNSINRLGGTEFSYPRVAVIDGRQDPWRAATPHKIGANAGRQSTTEQPFVLIDPATHHWDEFDIPQSQYREGYPPKQIVDVHNQEVEFVTAWLQDFYDQRG